MVMITTFSLDEKQCRDDSVQNVFGALSYFYEGLSAFDDEVLSVITRDWCRFSILTICIEIQGHMPHFPGVYHAVVCSESSIEASRPRQTVGPLEDIVDMDQLVRRRVDQTNTVAFETISFPLCDKNVLLSLAVPPFDACEARGLEAVRGSRYHVVDVELLAVEGRVAEAVL